MSRLGRKNGQRLVTVCAQCGAGKETSSRSRRFCSRKCYELSKRKYGICAYCDASFRSARGTNCCSRSCAQKLRPRRSGYSISAEHKRKIGDAQRGEKANNWQGGIYPEADAIRRRAKYKAWRKAVFERDNYTCQLCGARGGELNADHIKSFSKYPELRTELSNGRTLCVDCHKKTPSYARTLRYQED